MIDQPELTKIRTGWSARGDGWAVHGVTPEEAVAAYRAAKIEHRRILDREEAQDAEW